MSRLSIRLEDNPATVVLDTTEGPAIAAALADLGVRFERWSASQPLTPESGQDEILAAYAQDIERLKAEGGYQSVDVLRVRPDHPQRVELRAKFFAEHTHSDDEVRFFVEGRALFYLHLNGRVHLVTCEAGDLIGVPANTRHWFDMGPAPHFAAIRLFTRPDGWVAQFTGEPIAQNFPTFEAVHA